MTLTAMKTKKTKGTVAESGAETRALGLIPRRAEAAYIVVELAEGAKLPPAGAVVRVTWRKDGK